MFSMNFVFDTGIGQCWKETASKVVDEHITASCEDRKTCDLIEQINKTIEHLKYDYKISKMVYKKLAWNIELVFW